MSNSSHQTTHALWVFKTITPMHHSQGSQITYYREPAKPGAAKTEETEHKITLFRRAPVLLPADLPNPSGTAPAESEFQLYYLPIINSLPLRHVLVERIMHYLLDRLHLSSDAFNATPTGQVFYHTILSGGGLGGNETGVGKFAKTPENAQCIRTLAPFFLFGGSYSTLWPSAVAIDCAWPFVESLPIWQDFHDRLAAAHRIDLYERYATWWMPLHNAKDWNRLALFPRQPFSVQKLPAHPTNASLTPTDPPEKPYRIDHREQAVTHAFLSYRHIDPSRVTPLGDHTKNMPVALEVVPANMMFGLKLSWTADDTPWLMKALLQQALNDLDTTGFILGARGNRGLGQCSSVSTPSLVRNLEPLHQWFDANAPLLRLALTGTIQPQDTDYFQRLPLGNHKWDKSGFLPNLQALQPFFQPVAEEE